VITRRDFFIVGIRCASSEATKKLLGWRRQAHRKYLRTLTLRILKAATRQKMTFLTFFGFVVISRSRSAREWLGRESKSQWRETAYLV
jgi:hypothetical protein